MCSSLFFYVLYCFIAYQIMQREELKIDPTQLRAEAEKEPPRHGLTPYAEVIRLLKEEKGFSFREIASWLQARGVTVDHNAVWRTYAKAAAGGERGKYYERSELIERMPTHGGAMP